MASSDTTAGNRVNDGPITLMPFLHQVGGHAGVLKYNDSTVCKPLNQSELMFYQSLPDDMVQFVPEFRGQVDVYVEEENDGALNIRAYPQKGQTFPRGKRSPNSSGEGVDSDVEPLVVKKSPSTSRKHHKSHYHSTGHKRKSNCTSVHVSHNGSICIDPMDSSSESLFEDHSNGSGPPSSPALRNHTNETTGGQLSTARDPAGPLSAACNPWGLHCHHRQVAKMRRDQSGSKNHKFILLENVTSRFRYPCVLDLKMGTRSYGDDFSEEKRKSHIAKAKATTSASLGMRICGMQVYNAETKKFVCRNKYYGRRLSKDGLRKGICDFLYNGHRVRHELIPHIIRRLKDLIAIVTRQNSLRFYSSSLLIMYEGHMGSGSTNGEETAPSVGIKMIDFANTYHRGHRKNGTTTLHSGPDKGYIYGLENLLEMLNNLASTRESARKSERLLKDTTSGGSTNLSRVSSCTATTAPSSSNSTATLSTSI